MITSPPVPLVVEICRQKKTDSKTLVNNQARRALAMFDLEFHRRVAWCIKLFSCENSNPRALNRHQSHCERKHGVLCGEDLMMSETDEKRELMRDVREEYLPHFGIPLVEPSDKLHRLSRQPFKAKLKSDFLMSW
jgi:hypothetical protein